MSPNFSQLTKFQLVFRFENLKRRLQETFGIAITTRKQLMTKYDQEMNFREMEYFL